MAQALIVVITALAVFSVGLVVVTVGLRAFQPAPTPTPTVDLANLPITPFVSATPILISTATSTTVSTPIATSTLDPTQTSTPIPTPTSTPTVTPTPTPAETATATPYVGPFRNNGGDYTAFRHQGIRIDGNLDDWAGIPATQVTIVQSGLENYSGAGDLSVNVRLAWDEANLYYSIDVIDDVHVQEMSGFSLYNGDSSELWIDSDLPTDFDSAIITGDDFQIGFSPGNATGNPAEAAVWYPQRRPEWNQQIVAAAALRGGGYALEAAIPWTMLNVQPRSGLVLGYAINANDNDAPDTAAQQTILMQTPGMVWGQPTSFSNLRLE
ncbi:MAG: hypothetical protein J5I90_10885 [Caldilineales bacterium]|nr:hypothetical protein [Caldilineales bacterium]